MNVATLLTWTLVDPLRYERRAMEGTDPWNRVIATYGTCVMDEPWPYVSILVLLNVGLLLLANIQAFLARNINSEFSEAKYLVMVVACMLQACLIGVPLLFVVKELPQAWYLTLVFIIFIICMVVLLLIFAPKVHSYCQYRLRSDQSKTAIMSKIIRSSYAGYHNKAPHAFGVDSGSDESSTRPSQSGGKDIHPISHHKESTNILESIQEDGREDINSSETP